MDLFGKKSELPFAVVGGCSGCDMRGPGRTSVRKAGADAAAHGRRMHGNPNYQHLYLEGRALMAKTVGQVDETTGRVETRTVRRAKTTEIPWTPGPRTRLQKLKRALVG